MNFNDARTYRDTNLVRVPEKSVERSQGRCYVVGDTVFRRIDGQPMTEVDLLAMNSLSMGQTNYVSRGTVGDLECTVTWSCDSGD
jgi:hypothetical protein